MTTRSALGQMAFAVGEAQNASSGRGVCRELNRGFFVRG